MVHWLQEFLMKNSFVFRPASRRWSAGWPKISQIDFIWSQNTVSHQNMQKRPTATSFFTLDELRLGLDLLGRNFSAYLTILAEPREDQRAQRYLAHHHTQRPHVNGLSKGEAQDNLWSSACEGNNMTLSEGHCHHLKNKNVSSIQASHSTSTTLFMYLSTCNKALGNERPLQLHTCGTPSRNQSALLLRAAPDPSPA